MIQMGENPWQVHSIQEFSCLKCPECSFDTKKEDFFQNHATENHPLSYVLFTKPFKEENYLEDPLLSEDYKPDFKENYETQSEESIFMSIDETVIKIEDLDNVEAVHEDVNFEDLAIKYKHIEEFFIFQSSKLKENGVIGMEFLCVNCFPAKKVLRTSSQVPMWNLKNHMMKIHPDLADRFKFLLKSKKIQTKPDIQEELNKEEEIQKCEYCDFTSTRKSSITKHELSTHKESVGKPHVCSKCNRSYTTAKILRHHFCKVHERKKLKTKEKKIQEPEQKFLSGVAQPKTETVNINDSHNEDLNSEYLTLKYKHIEEFFIFESSKAKENGIIGMEFSCVNCLPARKVLKTSLHGKKSPISNLKTHLIYRHPDLLDIFKTLLRCNQNKSTQRKSRQVNVMKHTTVIDSNTKVKNEGDFCKELSLMEHVDVVHEGKKPYECTECDSQYRSKSGLMSHMESIHEGKTYSCPHCDKIFTVRASLQLHLKSFHEGGAFKCLQCEEVFSYKIELRQHRDEVHDKEKLYQCALCDSQFDTQSGYKSHKESKHQGLRYNCSKCDKIYTKKGALRSHVYDVHENKSKKCSLCDQRFSTADERLQHIDEVHDGKGSQMCSDCGLRFVNKCPICKKAPQKSVHGGEKLNTKCKICGKTFKSVFFLNKHISVVHEGEKPPLCPICGKSFGTKESLKRHEAAIHENKKPHKCSLCDGYYRDKSELRAHIQKVHGEKKHPCSLCKKRFTDIGGLNRHIKLVHDKSTAQTCHLCHKTFSSMSSLKYHISTVHEGKPKFWKKQKENKVVSVI